MWSYTDALAWLYGRQALGIKLGLQKVRDLLLALGDPQDTFESVHVAGTNGKGSVTRMLGDALQRAGHRTGTFTSPHLVRFTERIRVDGVPVAEADVAAGLAAIRPHAEALDARGEPPTFFEVNTALAFLIFRDEGVGWAVVETGMGGRLDATNVLAPRLTVITNIERDHTAHLGDTLGEITFEKAGIMKPGVPCVTAAAGDALAALKAVSRDREVPMSVVGEDYHVVPDINGLRLAHPGGEAHYDVGPAGAHQLQNAAVVVAAADALRVQGTDLPPRAVQEALAAADVPGRLESIRLEGSTVGVDQGPAEVLLDGAHNEAGARALRYHLGRIDWSGFDLIVGFNADKPWPTMLDEWMPLARHVTAVPLRTRRTLPADDVRPAVEAAGFPFSTCPDVRTAFAQALEAGAVRIVVAGSLFLVGEARAVLLGEPLEEVRGDQ